MIIKFSLTYAELARLTAWLTTKENVWVSYFPTAANPISNETPKMKLVEIKSVEGNSPFDLNVTLTVQDKFEAAIMGDGRYNAGGNREYAYAYPAIAIMELPAHLRRKEKNGYQHGCILLVDPTVYLSKMYAAINSVA